MESTRQTFAVVFGNRGFFPSHLIAEARKEVGEAVRGKGHEALMMDESATPNGAIETPADARVFQKFFHEHKRDIDGIIVSLPNFGDENGMSKALQDVDVPILVQAYPDELDKLDPAHRRDAFCGKLSIMDVLLQYGTAFTVLKPHTVHPKSEQFGENLDVFSEICSVVGSLRRLVVGAVGARTTPFKTVRTDELALQARGVTVETFDLANIFARIDGVAPDAPLFAEERTRLSMIAGMGDTPDGAFDNIARLSVVMRELAEEHSLDALALRCWTELQQRYRISPCLVTGDLAEHGMPAACEVDIANAVAMKALSCASGQPATILDWNNNYADDPDRCILFHCGNVPRSLMQEQGTLADHAILSNSIGAGKGFGCNQGGIRPMEFTYASLTTKDGEVSVYLGTGRITEDSLPVGFFGCAGVAEIPGLQDVLQWIGRNGHRHHVSITPGNHVEGIREALERYLGYAVTVL